MSSKTNDGIDRPIKLTQQQMEAVAMKMYAKDIHYNQGYHDCLADMFGTMERAVICAMLDDLRDKTDWTLSEVPHG